MEKERKDRIKKAEGASATGRGKKKIKPATDLAIAIDLSRQEALNSAQEISVDSEVTTEAAPGYQNALQGFRSDQEPCAICKAELTQDIHLESQIGGRRDDEKSKLKHLIVKQTTFPVFPGHSYSLMPAAFMEKWRTYITGSRKMLKGKTVTEPPKLEEFMSNIICVTHSSDGHKFKLAYAPPEVVNRRGRWMALNEKDCAFEIVMEQDWDLFWELYNTPSIPSRKEGITVFLSPISSTLDDSPMKRDVDTINEQEAPAGPLQNDETTVNDSGSAHNVNTTNTNHLGNHENIEKNQNDANNADTINRDDDTDTKAAEVQIPSAVGGVKIEPSPTNEAAQELPMVLKPIPPICEQCINDRSTAIKAAILNYIDKEVMVELVQTEADAVAATLLDGHANHTKPNPSHVVKDVSADVHVISIKERKSKRARKGRAPIAVDSSTTLQNFILRIYQGIGVHPLNARVFAKGCELHDKDKTMLDFEIYPGEEIRVLDTQEHDIEDLTSVFPEGKQTDTKEEGFTGTALVG